MRVVKRSGKTFNFPMGTSDEDIALAMEEYFEHETLPMITESPVFGRMSPEGAKTTLSTLTTGNPSELAAILENSLPGAKARRDMAGGFILDTEDGSFAVNKPGIDTGDTYRFLAQSAMFIPAGRAAGMAATIPGKIAIGGAASAATQAGIEATQERLGGEFDAGEVTFAGILGGGFEAAVPAAKGIIKKLREGRQAREAARQSLDVATLPETLDQAQKAQATTQATGVKFFRGQQTMDPFAIEEQSFLAQLPEGSRKAMKQLRAQDDEVANAVKEFLTSVAPSTTVRTARREGRKAAKAAIDKAKAKRSQAASPLYEQAFDEFHGVVNISPVMDEINVRRLMYPEGHAARNALDSFADNIQLNSDNLRRLQGVKEMADGVIDKIEGLKPSAQTNKARREVVGMNNILLDQMDSASPTFAKARKEFERLSPQVSRLEEGPIGLVAGLKDTQLKSLTQRILDPEEATTKTVLEAKRAIRGTEGGVEKWNAIVRAEMERRLANAKNSLDDVLMGNQRSLQNVPANILNSLFPKSKSRDVLRAALDKDGRIRLAFLEDALRRAGTGRGVGSQTGIRSEIRGKLGTGPGNAIRRFVSSPIDSVAQIGEEGARAAKIRAIADVAFDPDWSADVAQVMRLQRLGEATRAEQAMLRLLTNLEKSQTARAVIQASRED